MAAAPMTTSTNFSKDKNDYVLTAAPDDGGSVHKAKHMNPATGEEAAVAIKIFDVYKMEDIYSFTSDLHKAEKFDHDNIVKAHRSFMADDRLWVVMPPLGVPISSIIRSYFPQGLPENAVVFILKETLKALHYMHVKNEVHGSVGAGCIFVDDECRVKIGISSITQEGRGSVNIAMERPEFVADYGESKLDKATDILMFGFLALELLYGEIPRHDEVRSLMANRFGQKFRVLSCFRADDDDQRQSKRNIPAALAEVMAACLCRDPKARPTINQLIKFRLFRKRLFGDRDSKKLMKKLMMMNKGS